MILEVALGILLAFFILFLLFIWWQWIALLCGLFVILGCLFIFYLHEPNIAYVYMALVVTPIAYYTVDAIWEAISDVRNRFRDVWNWFREVASDLSYIALRLPGYLARRLRPAKEWWELADGRLPGRARVVRPHVSRAADMI
jgi:hypothetical protein